MAGKPSEQPPQPSRSDAGGADRPLRSSPAGERIGPLAIARHSKDDGRALILYSSDPQQRRDADGALP
jgi:hypothetical protein